MMGVLSRYEPGFPSLVFLYRYLSDRNGFFLLGVENASNICYAVNDLYQRLVLINVSAKSH